MATKQFGERLRELRLRKGLTQRQLAEPAFTHAYVSTIEAGKRQPSESAVDYFAEKLSVTTMELRTGQPESLPGELEIDLQTARLTLTHGDIEGARRRYQTVEAQARKFGLVRLHSRAVHGRGLCDEFSGNSEAAISLYQEAEQLVATASPSARVDFRTGQSRCLLTLGDVRRAVYILETLLDLFQESKIQDPVSLMKTHAALVLPYIELGQLSRSEASAAEALRLWPSVTDREAVAMMQVNVARTYLDNQQYDECDDALTRAEDLFAQLNLETEEGIAQLAHGIALTRQGKLDEAENRLQRAAAIFRKNKITLHEGRVLNELARVARLQGRNDEALKALQGARQALEPHGVAELGITLREMGELVAEENPELAEQHFLEAIARFEHAEHTHQQAHVYRLLGDLRRSRGESEAAADAYRLGILAVEPAL